MVMNHLLNPRHPVPPPEVRFLDPKNIPIKHQTSGGMTGCLGKWDDPPSKCWRCIVQIHPWASSDHHPRSIPQVNGERSPQSPKSVRRDAWVCNIRVALQAVTLSPIMVQWKMGANGRWLACLLSGAIFHWTMIMGGRYISYHGSLYYQQKTRHYSEEFPQNDNRFALFDPPKNMANFPPGNSRSPATAPSIFREHQSWRDFVAKK